MPESESRSPTGTLLQRWLLVRPGEGRALALAAIYFFCLLFSYYLLRPVREAFGIAGGADKLPWLMTATLLGMLLVNPLFAALVAGRARLRFIPFVYRCFGVQLLAFLALSQLLPSHGGKGLGYAFYIWLSIFNLFVVSLFWGLMSDVFSAERAARSFGTIALGGTLGAMLGAAATGLLSKLPVFAENPFLLVLPAWVALELAVRCMQGLARHFELGSARQAAREPGPGALAGLSLIARSRRLRLISAYILLYALSSTLLYLEQGRIVAQTFRSSAARTQAFAQLDVWVNILTLFTELFLTGRWVTRFGIAPMLLLLPLLTLLGFGALWLVPTFFVLAVFQVLRRGLHYAVDRPVRELLFVPVSADARYKSKPFIDTFIFRAGDFIGVWTPALLSGLALSNAPAALGVAAVWALAAAWLGRSRAEA